MHQKDYNDNFFQQPQQQQMQMPPQQQYMAQPTMPGGNYAPQGYQPQPGMFQNNVAAGMAPYDPRNLAPQYQQMQPPPNLQGQAPDFSKLANEYRATQKDIRNLISDDEAMDKLEQMKQVVDAVNGESETINKGIQIGNIAHAQMIIDQTIKLMRKPSEWLPPSRAQYVEKLISGGTAIVAALMKYNDTIEKLKVK